MVQPSRIARMVLLAAGTFFGSSGVAQDNGREALGQAAELSGQYSQALTHYTAALQAAPPGSDVESRLLERAASVSAKVRPLPPLPAEAERRFVRGQAAVQTARDAEAFQRAAEEFRAALRAAPWLADAYYNLGVVLDKAQRYDQATHALKLYILAAPNTKDAGEAQRLIYQIEFRQEEAQRLKAKEGAEAQSKFARQQALLQGFQGDLRGPPDSRGGYMMYVGSVSGSSVEIKQVQGYTPGYGFAPMGNVWRLVFNGLNAQGTYIQLLPDRQRTHSYPATGSLNPDGRILTLVNKSTCGGLAGIPLQECGTLFTTLIQAR